MPRRQVRQMKVSTVKVPEDKILELFFANQFILSDPAKSYGAIKFVLQYGQEHNTPAPGKHNFSTELEGTKHFLRLLEWYSGKDKMELKDVHVVETGLRNHGIKAHHFDAAEESMLRIIINLRENEDQHVGLGITITPKKDQKILCWLDMTRSFATILPGTLSELTIMSGDGTIPGKRRENGRSVYIIMDIMPKKDTQYNVADEIQKSMHVKKEQFISQLQRMQKDGTLPTEKFEAMMKDPENAFMNMMKEEITAKDAVPSVEQAAADAKEEEDCDMGAPVNNILQVGGADAAE